MSISTNSDVYAPTYDGGPGWVWGGGDAGWVYQGSGEQGGSQGSSSLTQTIIAALQQQSQQQSAPQQDWFTQANNAAMAAMVAAETISVQQAIPAPTSDAYMPAPNPEPIPEPTYGWVSSGDGPDQWALLTATNQAFIQAQPAALEPPAPTYPTHHALNQATPATQSAAIQNPGDGSTDGWVWGGGDAGWSYQPSSQMAPHVSSNDLLSTAITAAWNHEQQTAAHVASIAAAGSNAGALVNSLLTEQAAYSATDKSLGHIKTAAHQAAQPAAALVRAHHNTAAHSANSAATPNVLTRVDTPHRPQARVGSLWDGQTQAQSIAAIWNQYTQEHQADPYRLMQTMLEYGISADELAQASGQSVQDINAYFSRAGAPAGFAGADIIDRDAVDNAFLAALDQASQASTPPGMGSTFDVQAFSRWYAAQDSQASRDFALLHGAQFSQSQTLAVAGQWVGGGDAGQWVWQSAQLARPQATAQSQHLITSYLQYSQASEQELRAVDFVLRDDINQELLTHFGSDAPLPESEYVERMRARYGSERATQMLRIQEASQAVRAAYAAAIDAQQNNSPWPEDIQAQSTTPSVQLNSQDTRYTSASQPWWSVIQHIEYDNNHRTVQFDLQAYTDWYAAQDTPASRLFRQLYGSELTTVEHRENRGEGDIHEWSNTYIGAGGASEVVLGSYRDSGDQGSSWVSAAATDSGISASMVVMDPSQGDMKLFDEGAITFDPVMGFITANENIDNSDWTDMIPAVFIGAVAGAFLGPMAAQAVNLGGSTIAVAGFGGAIGSAFSSMVATGSIDFEQVLKSALTAALTAGFAEVTGANEAGLLTDARGNVVLIDGAHVVADWGTRISSMGAQAAFSGLLSDLMGGEFSQGFVQSMASQLGREIMNGIRSEINNSSTPLTATQQAAYNLMGRSIGAALTLAANPDSPGHALALAFVSEIGSGLGGGIGSVNPAANGVGNDTPSTNWSNTPVNGLTEDDGWTVAAGGGSAGDTQLGGNVELPNASTPELTEADQTVPAPLPNASTPELTPADQTIPGRRVVAAGGSNISTLLGTSNPQAIGNFMVANGLTSSTIQAGQSYLIPDDRYAFGDQTALGQATLNGDNARIAALNQERANANNYTGIPTATNTSPQWVSNRLGAAFDYVRSDSPLGRVFSLADNYPALSADIEQYRQWVVSGVMTPQAAEAAVLALPRVQSTQRSDYMPRVPMVGATQALRPVVPGIGAPALGAAASHWQNSTHYQLSMNLSQSWLALGYASPPGLATNTFFESLYFGTNMLNEDYDAAAWNVATGGANFLGARTSSIPGAVGRADGRGVNVELDAAFRADLRRDLPSHVPINGQSPVTRVDEAVASTVPPGSTAEVVRPGGMVELFTDARGSQVPGAVGVGPSTPGAAAADARSMPNIPSGSQATVVASNPYIPTGAGGTFSMMDYLPEAARITQPGGRIVINGNSANPYFTSVPTAAQLESMGLRIEYQGPILPEYQGMTFVTTTGRPIEPSTMRSIVFIKN